MRSGYAAVVEPVEEPVGTALVRSLAASDLKTRTIDLDDKVLRRADVDRIMAGDGSSAMGAIREDTLLVAQLKIEEHLTVIADAKMIEVAGTMDLAIVRNNCGAVTVQRHRGVSGKSVNETLEDGVRGLGEILKEKIASLLRPAAGQGERAAIGILLVRVR